MRHGKRAKDIEIVVPVGTRAWDVDDEERLLADMGSPRMRVEVARGGKGGRGNARFTSSTNQFPLLAERGEYGERLKVRLDLSLVGDVGIIGAPNAGKSSLLAAVTSAHPRIASYPFSTVEPSLGVVDHGRVRFVMVDIPGIIEGAHKGIGLGHDFLRHVERTRVLVHVLDGTEKNVAGIYRQVRDELGRFDTRLLEKYEIIALNKMDITEVEEESDGFLDRIAEDGKKIHRISAVTREGLHPLLNAIAAALEEVRVRTMNVDSQESLPPKMKPRLVDRQSAVRKLGGTYDVTSQRASQLADMVDENDWPARLQLYEHLRRMGIILALGKAGIKPGEKFKIGKLEWEWVE